MRASISARTSSRRDAARLATPIPMNVSTFGPPIQPGATQLTRTPVGPSSTAIVFAAVWIAAFDDE